MRQVVGLVALGRDDEHTLVLGVLDGATLGGPDGPLLGVVAAVEEPRVGEVAVVRHVDAVGPRPHEGADDGLGEEEAVGVAGLDAGDLDARCDTDDADAVGGRGDRAGGVRAVTVVVVGRDRARHRCPAHAVGAGGGVDVGCEVRVRVVEAGVDVADQHRGAAGA